MFAIAIQSTLYKFAQLPNKKKEEKNVQRYGPRNNNKKVELITTEGHL